MTTVIPPFYEGQTIIALKNHRDGFFKEGQRFSVIKIKLFCHMWGVVIGVVGNGEKYAYAQCTCGKKIDINNKTKNCLWFCSGYFRPDLDNFFKDNLVESENSLIFTF